MKTDLDLYTDYLISSFGQTSSTGLFNLLDKAISHVHKQIIAILINS